MNLTTNKGTAMPTFNTAEPISATVDIVVGDVRISASERDTTAVDVRPADPSNEEDVALAERTRVECANGQLVVKTPKLRSFLPRSGGGSIDVTIELPAGSNVRASGGVTDFHCDGRLGDCRIKTGIGQIGVDHAAGHLEVTSGSGDVRVRELDGGAVVKSSNGDTWVGTAGGDLRVSAANGDIAVDVARAGVVAKSANGDVRLGAAARGSVVLETRLGDVEVGIPEGTPAWLDVRSVAGRVRNELETADSPGPSADVVEVRARTTAGSIVIRRP